MENEALPVKIVKAGDIKVSMKDVGAYHEAKIEVIEYINFLKHPEKYEKMGARMPRGLLLYGPPGTGKTLLARATAGEANVTFVTCAASSFLSGKNGPKQLKAVFKLASEHSPCVLYFDEIDCIGHERKMHLRGGAAPVPQMLSLVEELLVQLDGFETDRDSVVLVIGSTNHIHSLDSALLRPGRFDRKVPMETPNAQARTAIYGIHLRPIVTAMSKEKLSAKLALLSNGFTGAMIAATCNEAAMIAVTNAFEAVTMEHLEQAIDRVLMGLRDQGSLLKEDRAVPAYHEAAHAVIGWYLPGVNPPTKLSIIPLKDRQRSGCSQQCIRVIGANKQEILNAIAILTAGRVAETMANQNGEQNASSAAAQDLNNATQLAMNAAVNYGLGDTLGYLSCAGSFANRMGSEGLNVPISEQQKEQIFKEVKTLVDQGTDIARKMLQEHKETLEKVANWLIDKNVMSFDEMEEMLGPCPIVMTDPKLEQQRAATSRMPMALRSWYM